MGEGVGDCAPASRGGKASAEASCEGRDRGAVILLAAVLLWAPAAASGLSGREAAEAVKEELAARSSAEYVSTGAFSEVAVAFGVFWETND